MTYGWDTTYWWDTFSIIWCYHQMTLLWKYFLIAHIKYRKPRSSEAPRHVRRNTSYFSSWVHHLLWFVGSSVESNDNDNNTFLLFFRVLVQQNTQSLAMVHLFSGYPSTTCLNFTLCWNLRQRMGLSVFLDRYNLLVWDRKPTLKSKQITFLFQIRISHECFCSKNMCRMPYSSFFSQLLILTSSVWLTWAKSFSFTHFVNVSTRVQAAVHLILL